MPDTYIKFDGVEGESQQTGATDWIEVQNISYSAYAPESADAGGGEGVGKPSYSPFSLSTIAGKHSNAINQNFDKGKHFPQVEIIYLKQSGEASAEWYRKITLKKVFITGYSENKSSDNLAHESLTFKFEEIKREYKKQESDGSLVASGESSYNNKTNVAS